MNRVVAVCSVVFALGCGPEIANDEVADVSRQTQALARPIDPEPTEPPPPPAPVAAPVPVSCTATTIRYNGQCYAALGAPPASMGLNATYTQYLDASGVAIVSQGKAPASTLFAARDVVLNMTAFRPTLRSVLQAYGIHVSMMSEYQVTTDIPEHATLTPKDSWDARSRGLGPTLSRPAQSAAEENLLCYQDVWFNGRPRDRYRGESIMVHEFAHTMMLAIQLSDSGLYSRIQQAYSSAMAAGLWRNTYAATNADEYFAEVTQSWFNANQYGPAGGDGVHNEIRYRSQVMFYDPYATAVLMEIFSNLLPGYSCPYDSDVRPFRSLAAAINPASFNRGRTGSGSVAYSAQSVMLGGRPPYRYSWSISPGGFVSTPTAANTTFSSSFVLACETNYDTLYLTVTDDNGSVTSVSAPVISSAVTAKYQYCP